MGGTVGRVGAGIMTMGGSELANEAMGGKLYGGGMGGKGGDAPSAPDFTGAAEAQSNSSHVNQSGPFGSTGWRQGPDGRWTQNTTLAPGLAAGVGNLESQIAGQGPLGTGDQAREAGTRAYYDRAASRLDPQWQNAETTFRSQMAGQGLDPGSAAYDSARGNFDRARNDAYGQAEREAQLTGSQLGAQTFEQNREAQMTPYAQLGAINGLTSGLSGTGPATQYLPAAMAAYNGALQKYGIDQAGKNSTMSGLGGLGSLALMAG